MTALTASRRPSLPRTPQRHSALGGTLIGVFIGIVVGLGLAATVAYWLMKNNPALPMPSLRGTVDTGKDALKTAKAEPDKLKLDFYKILPGADEPKGQVERRAPDRGDRAVAEQSKERPGDKAATRSSPATVETTPPRNDKAAPAETKTPKVAEAKPPVKSDRYWLQAGSFSAPPDAENLRARLALAGWEAQVQEGSLEDKGVRYRVRLGPYDNPDELGRMQKELAKRGFDALTIKY
jgi:cell division protein FtsN